MTSEDDLIAYKERWRAVAEVELQELRSTPIEMKWRQLNSVISLAVRMGIFKQDPSEEVTYQQWVKLKEKADKDHQ